jgi:hypothetical protein
MHSQTDYVSKYQCSIVLLFAIFLSVFTFYFDHTFFLFVYLLVQLPFTLAGLFPNLNSVAVTALSVLLVVPAADWMRSGDVKRFFRMLAPARASYPDTIEEERWDEPASAVHSKELWYFPLIAGSILTLIAYAIFIGDYRPDTFIQFQIVWFTLEFSLLLAAKAIQVNPKGKTAPLMVALCTVLLLCWMFGIVFFV